MNYKIENRLNPFLLSLVSRREDESLCLKDVHFTLIGEDERLALYIRQKGTESMITNLLRIWEFTFRNTEPNKEPYRSMLYSAVKGEGWTALINLTKRYLISTIGSSDHKNLAFRNIQNDKLALVPQVFVTMHASTFIESCVGDSVRSLIKLTKTLDTQAIIRSDQYKTSIIKLMSTFNNTIKNLLSVSPCLCRYICEICEIIKEIKGNNDY